MKLTQYFSRVKADIDPGMDGFLHEENMSLPSQGRGRDLPSKGEESPLEDRPYSTEEAYELFRKHNMPDPVTYQGDEYDFTGKMGVSFKKPRTLSFEYSNHGTIDNDPVERRLWMNIRGEITPD